MLKHVTKWATEVTSADASVSAVRKALATAASGRRGPAFVSIPLDLQGAMTSVPRVSLNVESHFEVDRSMARIHWEMLSDSELGGRVELGDREARLCLGGGDDRERQKEVAD